MKPVKVLETGKLPEELWEEVQYIFEGREDTATYIVADVLTDISPLDEYLIEQGCRAGEKIVVERGSW